MQRREFLSRALSGMMVIHMKDVKDLNVPPALGILKGSGRNLKTVPIDDSFFEKRSDTILAWLGMAGALINTRGTIILIDPLISYGANNETCETGDRLLVPLPVTADNIPKADIVCYTHADSDHFAEKSARILNTRLAPTFISPGPVFDSLSNIGVETNRLIKIKDFASYSFGDTEIMITPALHNWQEVNPWKREDCCGYLIKTPDGTIWHPGDTRLIPELEAVRDVDILFFDVAAVDSHLGPVGSARLAETSGAKVMIAYHYGTFDLPAGSYGGCDPDDSMPYVKDLKAAFLKPDPGEIVRLPLDQKSK